LSSASVVPSKPFTSNPKPKKAKGSGIGANYLGGLNGTTFSTPVVATKAETPISTSSASVSGYSTSYLDGLPGTSSSNVFISKAFVSNPKPKKSNGSGIGANYLGGLNGTTFSSPVIATKPATPAFVKPLPSASLSSEAIPGTDPLLIKTPIIVSKEIQEATARPVEGYLSSLAKESASATSVGGYLNSLARVYAVSVAGGSGPSSYLDSVSRPASLSSGPGLSGYIDGLAGKTFSSVPPVFEVSAPPERVLGERSDDVWVPEPDGNFFDVLVKNAMDFFGSLFGRPPAAPPVSVQAPKKIRTRADPVAVPVKVPQTVSLPVAADAAPAPASPLPAENSVVIKSVAVPAPSPPTPPFVANRERKPREEKGGALVVMNEAAVEFTAGVIGGVAGFAVAGPIGAVAVATVANYMSRQDGDLSVVVQSISKSAIEMYNYLLKLENKYDILYNTKISLEDALDKLKESEGANGEAIDKVEKAIAKTVSRMAEISDEYDLWGEATGALSVVGDLVEKTVTKIGILNRDLQLFDRLFTVMMEAAATAKVAVDEATREAYAEEDRLKAAERAALKDEAGVVD